jgi:uncharacterized protein YuzE
MKITYDDQADACYIYFTVIGVGGVADMFINHPLAIDLDANNQIVGIRLSESDECKFLNRTRYVVQNPGVEYRQDEATLHLNFSDVPLARTVPWDGNIDLDSDGQIVGLEILFYEPGTEPRDGFERLSVDDKLEHMQKFIVPFDDIN